MLQLLRNKQFRNFFIADIFSSFGVGLTTVGANWYVMEQTKSNQLVGFYLTVNVLAGFIMSPIAGHLTDKLSRRYVILWSFLGRAIPMSLIAFYFSVAGFNLVMMYFLAALTGAGWITYMSSSRGYIQSIISPDLLGSANSFIEISLQVGMFIAGAVSGIILHYTGFLVILIINIVMFLLSTILILRSPKDSIVVISHKNANQKSFGSIFHYLKSNPLVLLVGILSVLPLLVTQLFNVSAPDYVSTVLNKNSLVYGTVDMLYGIGGLTSGFVTGWLLKKMSQKKMIFGYFLIASVALSTLYVHRGVLALYIGTYFIGLTDSSLRIVTNTILMKNVQQKYMGRITAFWNGTAQFIEIFASSWIGLMNDQIGAEFGFLIMAGIMILGILLSFLIHSTDSRR
ncbi:MFS transporter [Bombilactobacillus folatiphilus]|uniref:MFS transporter n=1 Tax=Bombilactobacillus folatiphilus TaxID=2923362 RepID=A0ABY4P861_9LACO|nr:MFS transporter [Bombilactobacillus folatiphilus]UQS81775.1 MFS transporter [Bombilactobacillus folatiphilus]